LAMVEAMSAALGKSIYQLLTHPPLAGSGLDVERLKNDPRTIALD
jgi:hypothetical protein